MLVQSYLNFDGQCEEAINFYKRALGAQVDALLRMKDCPEAPRPGACPPGGAEMVMHCAFRIGETTLMASDCHGVGKPEFKGFSLAITVNRESEADRVFGALADGGQVQAPLSKTFFSPRFGVVSDRFGVSWMVVTMP